jgi:hypothetical protein
LESVVVRGLLLPKKTATAKLYSGQRPVRVKDGKPRAEVFKLDMAAARGQRWQRVGDWWYPVRQTPPLTDDEMFTLKCLRDLSRLVSRFARYYAENRRDDAFLLSFQIGKLSERVDVLTFAPIVKYGRPQLQQLTSNREKATANRRKEQQPLWDKIVRKVRSGKSWGRTHLEMEHEGTPVSRSMIARAMRRCRKGTSAK